MKQGLEEGLKQSVESASLTKKMRTDPGTLNISALPVHAPMLAVVV